MKAGKWERLTHSPIVHPWTMMVHSQHTPGKRNETDFDSVAKAANSIGTRNKMHILKQHSRSLNALKPHMSKSLRIANAAMMCERRLCPAAVLAKPAAIPACS